MSSSDADTEQDLLITKLCALLGRSEPRDLWDTQVLLERGASLEDAVAKAPRHDAGFSVPTLAWVLESLDIEPLPRAAGIGAGRAGELSAFKVELLERLLQIGVPGR